MKFGFFKLFLRIFCTYLTHEFYGCILRKKHTAHQFDLGEPFCINPIELGSDCDPKSVKIEHSSPKITRALVQLRFLVDFTRAILLVFSNTQ